MPTATSLSAFALTNLGPLTTTFTAPASCSTAYQTLLAPVDYPAFFIQWAADCNYLPPADCHPYGDVFNSMGSSARGGNPTANNYIPYQSPGLFCPSNWATVGAATKLNPSSSSTSGVFDVWGATPTNTIKHPRSFFQPGLDVFLSALDPGETAIACCPSSYTETGGACYSMVPTSVYTPTAGCERLFPPGDLERISGIWTIGGETITGDLISITGTTPIIVTSTSFSPSEATSYVGVAYEPLLLLVHRDPNTAMASSTGDSDTTRSSTTSTATSPSKTNAAVSVRGNENGVGAVTIVCCLALALRALLWD